MVFFTCNACGSSLKKNQVEKHYQNECRNCSVLSCMDCGQDFYGDEYANHTKCVSEAEKYQGAMFKGNANKGDKKQQEWLQRAHSAIQSAKVGPRISGLLERMMDYPNIPRKKAKFENFIRNSLNIRDQNTLDKLWSIFTQDSQTPSSGTVNGGTDSETKPILAPNEPLKRNGDCNIDKENMQETERGNKRDQKDKEACDSGEELDREHKKKKKKKMKCSAEGESESGANVTEEVTASSSSTKKKRKKDQEQFDEVELDQGVKDGDSYTVVGGGSVKSGKKKKTKKISESEVKSDNGETVKPREDGILSNGGSENTAALACEDDTEVSLVKPKKKKEKKSLLVDDIKRESPVEQVEGDCIQTDKKAGDRMVNGTVGEEEAHKSKRKKRKHLTGLGDNEGDHKAKIPRVDLNEVECVVGEEASMEQSEKKVKKSHKLRRTVDAEGCNGDIHKLPEERSELDVLKKKKRKKEKKLQ